MLDWDLLANMASGFFFGVAGGALTFITMSRLARRRFGKFAAEATRKLMDQKATKAGKAKTQGGKK